MNFKHILALDPSGNFKEGKGTTGWCIFDCANMRITKTGFISAHNFKTMQDYWNAHIELLDKTIKRYGVENCCVVIEDYLLYASQTATQINSRMETPKLIGVLQLWCYNHQVFYWMQNASDVKKRWANDILHYKGYIKQYKNGYRIPTEKEQLNRHCLDSIRHAVHYATFRNRKEQKC